MSDYSSTYTLRASGIVREDEIRIVNVTRDILNWVGDYNRKYSHKQICKGKETGRRYHKFFSVHTAHDMNDVLNAINIEIGKISNDYEACVTYNRYGTASVSIRPNV